MELNFHADKYVYTKEDVDRALGDLKMHEEKVKEEEFTKIIE